MLWGACHFRIAPAGRLMNQLMGPFNGHNVTPDGVLPDRLQHWGRRPSSTSNGTFSPCRGEPTGPGTLHRETELGLSSRALGPSIEDRDTPVLAD